MQVWRIFAYLQHVAVLASWSRLFALNAMSSPLIPSDEMGVVNGCVMRARIGVRHERWHRFFWNPPTPRSGRVL
jgi:hypothetical protein